jgi:hypothetical protein
LDEYFTALGANPEVEDEWRRLYSLAVAGQALSDSTPAGVVGSLDDSKAGNRAFELLRMNLPS